MAGVDKIIEKVKNQPNGIRMSEADRVLTANGYRLDRQKGSHRQYINAVGDVITVKDYLNLPYDFVIKSITDESGTYFHAMVLELDGCQSTGETFQEAYEGLREAMEGWIETKLANGLAI